MSHQNPLNMGPPTEGIGDAVEGVPRYAADSLHARGHQRLYHHKTKGVVLRREQDRGHLGLIPHLCQEDGKEGYMTLASV